MKNAAHYESMDEQHFYAQRSFPVTIYKGSVGMGREVLSANIFRVGRGQREQLDFSTVSSRGTQIRYKGEELRQDDERLLAFLIHATRGKVATCAIEFDVYNFVESIGWDRHKRSVERLDESLERMAGSRITIGTAKSYVRVQLVGRVIVDENRRSVWLHNEVVELFQNGCTYLPLEERKAAPDGIASWLLGFLRANDDESMFSMADLHKFSGSSSTVAKFQQNLKEACERMQPEGTPKRFQFGYGKLKVLKGGHV